MVYVVSIESLLNGSFKVSQEAYSTLKAAQDFCENRSDYPHRVNKYHFISPLNAYTITEVAVK